MPELPEVETVRRGIEQHLENKIVKNVIIRQHSLRWPIPQRLPQYLRGKTLQNCLRRGKYLLLTFATGKDNYGTLLMHLGMSGCIRILPREREAKKHDHLDILFHDGQCLRFNDPRRFGAVLWTTKAIEQHTLIKHLGPEPLSRLFNSNYLYQLSKNKRCPIKNLIMNHYVVVGVGNIYANEALFRAGILPSRVSNDISKDDCNKLVRAIKDILRRAIAKGGTTLQDFQSTTGKPGYFRQVLQVYGRGNESCYKCQQPLCEIRLQNRSTVYCRYCQK